MAYCADLMCRCPAWMRGFESRPARAAGYFIRIVLVVGVAVWCWCLSAVSSVASRRWAAAMYRVSWVGVWWVRASSRAGPASVVVGVVVSPRVTVSRSRAASRAWSGVRWFRCACFQMAFSASACAWAGACSVAPSSTASRMVRRVSVEPGSWRTSLMVALASRISLSVFGPLL